MSQNKQKWKHLDHARRGMIEALICEGHSIRYIAERIGCSPSTISREIRNHTHVIASHSNDCLNRPDCHRKNMCGGSSCTKKCKTCNKCKKYCQDYVQAYCDILEENGLCNGCRKIQFCHYQKKVYKADVAQDEYRKILKDRRSGFDLTGEQMEEINQLVSPLIRKGQSPYHIKQALGDRLTISEATLRRMINGQELDVRAIDLKECVRRKPRKKKRTMNNELSSPSKAGHTYDDYLSYIGTHDVSVVEMDCVEGKQEDQKAILTLHFVSLHMQLYYIMDEHTSMCVIETLDLIEDAIGSVLFHELFELILTDNGHEFWNFVEMERSINGGKRTKIFFCEPNRSDQKGACENNHKLFRCIVPKGTSIDTYDQSDMIIATNHVNSYCRKSLFGRSPYELAMESIPGDFFTYLGLEIIPPENVCLTPDLLNKMSD